MGPRVNPCFCGVPRTSTGEYCGMADDDRYVWLSYPEAATALGLSVRAVEGRVYRGGWKKQKGNDGMLRLAVPVALLAPTTRGGGVGSDPLRGSTHGDTEAHAQQAMLDELKASHDRLVAELRQRIDTAEARAIAAETLVSQRASELTAQHERAERAESEAAARLREVEAAREAAGREQGRANAEQQARAAAEAERDAARSELAGWTAGGPLARAWRAFLNRRGRA